MLLENNETSEKKRKLIEEVNEIDRLRDENISKQNALRESIQDELQEIETEFSDLNHQRRLKEEAFSQLKHREDHEAVIGSRVTFNFHDRKGRAFFPVGVVKETWHNYAMVALEPDSEMYDDFDGRWIGPTHGLSLVEEDRTEELAIPDDQYRECPF